MNTGSSCSSTMDRPTPTCCVRCLALLRVTGASSWQNWKDTRVSRERQIVDSRLPAESGSLFYHDDVLEPDSLFQVVKLLQQHPDADLIYSDEDKLGDDGFEAPLFKPDWSPDFFLSCNYLGHLSAVRRDIVQKAGGFRSQFDSAQDYDLFFRVVEQTNRIHHIPRVLYHWRRSESSSAISVRQKPGQLEATRLAIQDHLKRRGERAHVAVDWRTHAFCVRRKLSETRKISVIVSSCHGPESLERCIGSLTSKTSYPNYEIVIAHGDEFPQAAKPLHRDR